MEGKLFTYGERWTKHILWFMVDWMTLSRLLIFISETDRSGALKMAAVSRDAQLLQASAGLTSAQSPEHPQEGWGVMTSSVQPGRTKEVD